MNRFKFFSSWLLVLFFHYGWAQSSGAVTGFRPAPENENHEALLEQLDAAYATRLSELEAADLTNKQRSVLKESYKSRLAAGKTILESNSTILSGRLYDYINGIFTAVVRANPAIDPNSRLVLYRDREFNAFTLGDNIIFVNLGLLYRLRNREQLALVIAHELAHNVGEHVQQAMIDNVRIQTDEALNRQVRQTAGQQYGRVTALNELLLPTIYAQRETSRRHEFEADSLGLVFFGNAGFTSVRSMGLFAIMEAAGHVYEQQPLDLVTAFGIDPAGTIGQRYARYSHASSLGVFSEEENPHEAYLRSHPYDGDREAAILRQLGVPGFDTLVPVDEEFLEYRYLVEGEMVYSALGEGDFSDGIYYALRMEQHYPQDPYARAALAYQLGMLSFYKTNRMAGKHLQRQNPKTDEVLDRVNYFLQTLTPAEALDLSRKFRDGLPAAYENKLTALTDAQYDCSAAKYSTFELRRDALFPEVANTMLEKPLQDLEENYDVREPHPRPSYMQTNKNK